MNTLLAQLNARAALLEGPLEVSKVEFHISALGAGGDGADRNRDWERERAERIRAGDLERGTGRHRGRNAMKMPHGLDVGKAQTGSVSKATYSSTPGSPFALALTHVRHPSGGSGSSTKGGDGDGYGDGEESLTPTPTDVGAGVPVPVSLGEDDVRLR